jgi:hypothetical protein
MLVRRAKVMVVKQESPASVPSPGARRRPINDSMPLNQVNIPKSLKIAVRIVNGIMLFVLLSGGSLQELTHISDLERTARAFLGILAGCIPFYVALRAVAAPVRRRIAVAFFVNGGLVLVVALIVVAAMIDDFNRMAPDVPTIGLVCIPVLFNAIIFGSFWWKGRASGNGARVPEAGHLEVQHGDISQPHKTSERSYLVRHWQGSLPLWVAFWLNWLVIATATTTVLRAVVNEMLDSGYPVRSIAIVSILVSCGLLLVWLWSTVGVWRSSNWRQSRGFKRLWCSLSRVIVVIGCINTVQQLRMYAFPEIIDYAQFLVGQDEIGSVSLSLSSDQQVLEIRGMLGVGTYDAIKAKLDEFPSVRMLEIDSGGGRMYEGAAIARLIRTRDLDVKVTEQCLSACTLVLLAGRNRIALPTAWIGFHRPSNRGFDKRVDAYLASRSMNLYRKAGLAEDFISRIHKTPSDDMWYPTANELKASGVINYTAGESGRYSWTYSQ